MMTETRTLASLASQFSLSCNFVTFYYMMILHEGPIGWFFPQVLLVYGPMVYVLNRLFLRRERTLRGLYALNIAAGVLLMAAYCFFETWKGVAGLLISAFLVVGLTVRGSRLAMSGSDLRSTLISLDVSIVMLVLFATYAALMDIELIWNSPAICGFAAAIIGVTSCRSNRPLGWKSWLFMAAAFAAIFLGMWLLIGVAAAPAGQGLVTLWNLLTAAVKFVRDTLLRLLLAVFALFPNAGQGELVWEEAGDFTTEEPTMQEADPLLAQIFTGIALFVVAVLLVRLLIRVIRRLGKIKLGGMSAGADTPADRRERRSIWHGLRSLAASWVNRIRFRIFLRKNRNTPKGLYSFLVHRCRMGPWHKHPGETPREFLNRLAHCAQNNPPLAEALIQLAHEVDAALYSGHPGQKRVEHADFILRQIGDAVHRQFIRELLSRNRKSSIGQPSQTM